MPLYRAKTPTEGRRNLFDNGAMIIAQRGVGPTTVSLAGGFATADRWASLNFNLGNWSQDVINTDGITGRVSALRTTCSTADAAPLSTSYMYVSQTIEGYTLVRAMQGSTSLKGLALTFDAYSNVSGTYTILTVQVRSAGTTSRSVSSSYNLTANTWSRISLPIPPDLSADVALNNQSALTVYFCLGAGSSLTGGGSLNTSWAAWPGTSNTRHVGQTNLASAVGQFLQITRAQLEVGAPTPFENLSYDDDLRQCQRYFQRWQRPPFRGLVFSATGLSRMGMALPVEMRTAPTVTASGTFPVWDGTTTTSATVGTVYSTAKVVEMDMTTTGVMAVGRPAVLYQDSGGGYMDFGADII